MRVKIVTFAPVKNADEVRQAARVLSFDSRKKVLESVKYIDKIHKVDDYMQELDNHSHLTIIHGDDWSNKLVEMVRSMCDKNGGKLLLAPYGDGINSTKIQKKLLERDKTT